MAHGLQRRPVRGARDAAHRGPGALRRAALGLLVAAGLTAPAAARAQAPPGDHAALLESGRADAPAWWGLPGRSGAIPDADWGAAFPWSLAGLVQGAWTLEELEAGARPFPGPFQVRSPLGWYDSLDVATGGDGAWSGFAAGLARARLMRAPLRPDANGRTRALGDLVLGSGSSGYDENALWLRRGDTLSFAEAGAEARKIDGFGPYGPSGRHQYGARGAWNRGPVALEGAFTQRGAAAALVGGEEQAVGGASGWASAGYDTRRGRLTLSLGRAYDGHESFGGPLFYSRRDAGESWGAIEWRSDSVWSARLHVRDAQVSRVTELDFDPPRDWNATSVWLALQTAAHRQSATVTAGLGVGRQRGLEGTQVAPSFSFAFAEPPFRTRVFVERVLTPVWSDLALGENAFLQSTWAGGFDLTLRGARRGGIQMGWLMGRTHDRAIVERLPLEELWLRSGFGRETGAYDFGLATGSVDLRGRWWGLGAEGFALLRDRSALQPNVDPSTGGRAFLEARWRAFRDDLGVRLRGEMEAVGERESEAFVPIALGQEITFGIGAAMTLADATVTISVRNLADRHVVQTWIDSATGVEALGGGRELRVTAGWRFFN